MGIRKIEWEQYICDKCAFETEPFVVNRNTPKGWMREFYDCGNYRCGSGCSDWLCPECAEKRPLSNLMSVD